MGKRKIINDPLYGFIYFDFDLLYDLIDHPHFQRLRRISQMGLSSLIYPGAVHTRFHHALGALHLMTIALRTLARKGIKISSKEAEAVSVAILLHDIGHGPFSHALENILLPISHEELTLQIMLELNQEFEGKLDLAIEIFKGEYERDFLHQLVSSQLDMDRLDYLNRDSFFSGVTEGKVGYERIISMLNVVDQQLVVEEKALYSIEKFILSRRMMYLQVYYHKASIVAEQLLIKFMTRIKELHKQRLLETKLLDPNLMECLELKNSRNSFKILKNYLALDDSNIWYLLKNAQYSNDLVLKDLSQALVDRKLWKIIVQNQPFSCDFIENIRLKVVNYMSEPINKDLLEYFVFKGCESNQLYTKEKGEILVLRKDKHVVPLSLLSSIENIGTIKELYYLCYPKYIG